MEQYNIGAHVFGDWEIVKELGQGSYGTVYELQKADYGITTKSALKVLHIPRSISEVKQALNEGMDEQSVTSYFQDEVDRLLKEIMVMAALKSHPNIVSYEDHKVESHAGEIGWDILIRMELLTSFQDYKLQHAMDEAEIRRLGAELSDALVFCQKQGLIHRDIKPGNIFVSETGHFKLGDFGVARVAEKTLSGLSKQGTESYMAPEVYLGQPYGASVDIYSLGLVLYQLMNRGRLPFFPPAPEPISYADRENAHIKRIKGVPLPPPQGASPEFAAIILKACAFDSRERYRTAAEMLEALNGNAKTGITPPPVETAPSPPPIFSDDLGDDGTLPVFWGSQPNPPKKDSSGGITIEEPATAGTGVDTAEGMQFNRGYIASDKVTDTTAPLPLPIFSDNLGGDETLPAFGVLRKDPPKKAPSGGSGPSGEMTQNKKTPPPSLSLKGISGYSDRNGKARWFHKVKVHLPNLNLQIQSGECVILTGIYANDVPYAISTSKKLRPIDLRFDGILAEDLSALTRDERISCQLNSGIIRIGQYEMSPDTSPDGKKLARYLYYNRTVYTIIDEFLYRWKKLHNDSLVQAMAEHLELTDYLSVEYQNLSMEQRSLTLLARFLVLEPKILLLEDPLAGWDDLQRAQAMWDKLARLRPTLNATILLTTDHPELARSFGDRVIDINSPT